jgi:hypothetical protein
VKPVADLFGGDVYAIERVDDEVLRPRAANASQTTCV